MGTFELCHLQWATCRLLELPRQTSLEVQAPCPVAVCEICGVQFQPKHPTIVFCLARSSLEHGHLHSPIVQVKRLSCVQQSAAVCF